MFEFCFCNIKNKKANKKQPLIKSDCFKKSDQEMTASFANGIQLIVFCFNKERVQLLQLSDDRGSDTENKARSSREERG